MSNVETILKFNQSFVEQKDYEIFETNKYPNKKLAIISCMDARLLELLPKALGLKNGDAKIIKNAGALVSHPYGSVMRSLIICIYELGVEEILVIGHEDCGMQNLDANKIIEKMIQSGVSQEKLSEIRNEIDINEWIKGFSSVQESVKATVATIKNHDLIPDSVLVTGLIMNPSTGQLKIIDSIKNIGD